MTSLKKRVDKFSHILLDRFDDIRAMYEKDAGYHPPEEWNGSGE
jgi:hypothetical protein